MIARDAASSGWRTIMGTTVSDVVTSAPSAWGAANAVSASIVFPLAAIAAVPLTALVSDPAQMWHAGERYGDVAGHIRSASTEIARAVARHADDDHWSEQGKTAFVATRVKPYRDTLEQAAVMFDHIRDTLRGCAVAYTGVGLSSAVIGSVVLSSVASMLALAVVPGVNATATYVANARMIEAGQFVRALIAGLAKVNGVSAAIFARATAELGTSKAVLSALTAGGTVLGGYYIGGRAAPSFKDTETALNWPKQLPPGAPVPTGYRAPSAAEKNAIKKIDPGSIKALGKDLDVGAGETLGAAYDQARGNDVGYPGFGLVGLHVAHAHTEMRDHAAQQLAACRDTPGAWLPGLKTSADNWVFAEQASVNATQHVR
jgi:hypothetical protein